MAWPGLKGKNLLKVDNPLRRVVGAGESRIPPFWVKAGPSSISKQGVLRVLELWDFHG